MKNDNPIRKKILKGMELTHRRLIQYKKDRNLDLVIYDNGKVVKIPAKDLKI